MSMQSPTDAESFYEFMGHTLSHGERETPPEALLGKWREQREFEEACEDIRQGWKDMQAGLGRPLHEVADEIRRKHGFGEKGADFQSSSYRKRKLS